MDDKFKRLALNEKAAAAAQESAQEAYREAWWRLTLALAGADKPGQVYRKVAPIVGLSERYLGSRRSLGMRVTQDVIDSGEVYKLPPRKAIAFMNARSDAKIDADAVKMLRQFEEEGVSLRAMSAALGANVPSWQSKAQRDEELTAAAQGKVTPALVKHMLVNDPELRREVVGDRDVSKAIHRERIQQTEESVRNHFGYGPDRSRDRQSVEDTQFDSFLTIERRLVESRASLRDALRLLGDYPVGSESGKWSKIAEDISLLAQGMTDRLRGQREFDEAVQELLESEGV